MLTQVTAENVGDPFLRHSADSLISLQSIIWPCEWPIVLSAKLSVMVWTDHGECTLWLNVTEARWLLTWRMSRRFSGMKLVHDDWWPLRPHDIGARLEVRCELHVTEQNSVATVNREWYLASEKHVCLTPFTRYSRLSNRLYNRFDNRLYRVNKQLFVQPVVKPCLTNRFGKHGLTTVLNEQLFVQHLPGWQTSNRIDNRFDNRLYRVNGAFQLLFGSEQINFTFISIPVINDIISLLKL